MAKNETHLEVELLVQQEVLGLDVAMADAAPVAVRHAAQELPHVAPRRLLRRPAPQGDAVKELPAWRERECVEREENK